MAFATTTWDGWDYMPRAWPRWLEERDGVMLVGAVGEPEARSPASDANGHDIEPGSVVAIVRVAIPALGEAWLEGIRVDPRVRGMEVATDLQVAELYWARANGARVVRYATSARNEGSIRLGARAGLVQVASLLGVSWEAPKVEAAHELEAHYDSAFLPAVQARGQQRRESLLRQLEAGGEIATGADADHLWAWLDRDETFNAGARLYEPRPWALEELTESKFREHLRRGEVITQKQSGDGSNGDGGALAILVRDLPPTEDSALRLAVVAGAPRAAFELIDMVRRTANETIRLRYPEGASLIDGARQSYIEAGYELSDWAMVILARPIDTAHPVPPVDARAVVMEDRPRAVITPPR